MICSKKEYQVHILSSTQRELAYILSAITRKLGQAGQHVVIRLRDQRCQAHHIGG
jgi:hypothetical protein